ncbi:MAG: hypothetical protein K2Y22_04265 [Candidatus Obscuribacterales bacterium]|nr:hypothetical protein [Candidatus Obscuribacterales bacterium]
MRVFDIFFNRLLGRFSKKKRKPIQDSLIAGLFDIGAGGGAELAQLIKTDPQTIKEQPDYKALFIELAQHISDHWDDLDSDDICEIIRKGKLSCKNCADPPLDGSIGNFYWVDGGFCTEDCKQDYAKRFSGKDPVGNREELKELGSFLYRIEPGAFNKAIEEEE